MRDFNFDPLCLNNDNLEFFTLMVSHDLYPLVGIPTHITQHSVTLIDNIFVQSCLLATSYADVIINESAIHFPVGAVTSFLHRQKPKIKRIKKRLLKKQNIDKFR